MRFHHRERGVVVELIGGCSDELDGRLDDVPTLFIHDGGRFSQGRSMLDKREEGREEQIAPIVAMLGQDGVRKHLVQKHRKWHGLGECVELPRLQGELDVASDEIRRHRMSILQRHPAEQVNEGQVKVSFEASTLEIKMIQVGVIHALRVENTVIAIKEGTDEGR